jgi:hypothetical protein
MLSGVGSRLALWECVFTAGFSKPRLDSYLFEDEFRSFAANDTPKVAD